MISYSLIILLFLTLSGCSEKENSNQNSKYRLEKIKIQTSEDMNHETPMAVDLVLIYDQKSLDELQNMPAKEYFQNLSEIKSQAGNAISVYRWYTMPGQDAKSFEIITPSAKPLGAIIFMNYNNNKGYHRYLVTNYKNILLTLGKDHGSILQNTIVKKSHKEIENLLKMLSTVNMDALSS